MAIPSAAEFSEWILRANARPVLPISLPQDRDEPIDREFGIAFLESAYAKRDEDWQEMWNTVAGRWLASQSSFHIAHELVYRRGRRRKRSTAQPEYGTPELTPHGRACRDFEEANRLTEVDKSRRQVLRRLEHYSTRPFQYHWQCMCMAGLAEYFDGSAAAALVEARKEIRTAAAAASEALANYLKFAQVLHEHGFFARELRAALRHEELLVPDIDALPLKRLDETSGERLLVYRIWSANRSAVRSPRTEAIAEFMGIEGIQHRYDSRTIERLCAHFSDISKAKNPAEAPGQLLARARQRYAAT